MTQVESIYYNHLKKLSTASIREVFISAIQEALDAGELKGFSKGIDSANKVEKEIADWTNVVELRKELAAKEKELQELRDAQCIRRLGKLYVGQRVVIVSDKNSSEQPGMYSESFNVGDILTVVKILKYEITCANHEGGLWQIHPLDLSPVKNFTNE